MNSSLATIHLVMKIYLRSGHVKPFLHFSEKKAVRDFRKITLEQTWLALDARRRGDFENHLDPREHHSKWEVARLSQFAHVSQTLLDCTEAAEAKLLDHMPWTMTDYDHMRTLVLAVGGIRIWHREYGLNRHDSMNFISNNIDCIGIQEMLEMLAKWKASNA